MAWPACEAPGSGKAACSGLTIPEAKKACESDVMNRLLYVSHRVPYPPDKGERVRAFHEIQALSRDFRITLACLTHSPADCEAAEALRKWCDQIVLAPAGGMAGRARGGLCLLRGKSATEGFFHSRKLVTMLTEEASQRPFDLVFAYCSSVLPAALAVPAAAHVIDLVDTDSAKWESYAQGSRWPGSWVYRLEARAVRRLETQAVDRCQAVFLTSQAEIEALGSPSPKVMAIGNGVDTEFFDPEGPWPCPDPNAPSLVFTGWMNYRPNVDGVCWFVREVWPELKRRVPSLTLQIVGRNPTPAVQRLAQVQGVVVTGSVPDVRPYLAAAAIAIVPLRIARGVQNKVLEAMAMGKPVVASPAATKGLDAAPGRELVLADLTGEWVDRILSLLKDVRSSSELGRLARTCVVQRYNWAARLQPLVESCKRLAESPTPAQPALWFGGVR